MIFELHQDNVPAATAEESVLLGITCDFCGATCKPFHVERTSLEEWQEGKLIQDALPNLTPEQREAMISGMCPTCWNRTFKNVKE